jgi:FtsP/CotA-like multicopper oxidase with cupredoxin domain
VLFRSSINGAPRPYAAELPAGGLVRLRLLAADVTRVYRLETEGEAEEALILATDGNPLEKPWRLEQHALGPGMRVDIGLRLPAKPGATLRLVDYSAGTAFPLAEFTTKAADAKPGRAWPVLAVNPIPMADLAQAELLPFEFSAGQGQGASICAPGQKEWILWAINKRAAQEDPSLEPPLYALKAGRSYIAEFVNRTPHTHPIHMHGHTFRILESNQDDAPPPHWADTALLRPDERIRAAFVAAPGRWMLHCHILEHQISGMMGYIEVA